MENDMHYKDSQWIDSLVPGSPQCISQISIFRSCIAIASGEITTLRWLNIGSVNELTLDSNIMTDHWKK